MTGGNAVRSTRAETCNTKWISQSVEASRKHNRLDVQGNRIEAARWVEHHHFVSNHTYR